MKNASMAVPPKTYRRGRNIGVTVSLFALAGGLIAQELPPIPGGGDTKPRDPTPEELEEQRKAREAVLRKNIERFEPYLIKTVEQLAGDSPVDGRFLSLDELLWRRYEGAPSLEERLRASGEQEAKRADDARKFGVPLLSRTDEGDVVVFDGVDETGRPIFRQSQSLNAAKTIQTDKVWPGGSLGLSLTGTNRTVAFWDVQHPFTAHPVFGSHPYERLFIIDWYSTPGNPLSDHATRIAGILGGTQGTGTPGSSFKGMAFGSLIHAYNHWQDFEELRIAYTNIGQVRITSHSYGQIVGWTKVTVDNFPAWAWVGLTNVSQNEDLWFGRYDGAISSNIDHVAYSQPYQLSVWSAGNEGVTGRGQPPPIQPTNHYVFPGGFGFSAPQLVTGVTRPADGDAGGYDTLPPEATAKNTIVVGSVTNLPSGYQGTNSVFLDPQSSYGPTDAGLIKPDLVAAGVDVIAPIAPNTYNTDSGTSYAAPSVAGSLLLLLDHFLATHTNYTSVLASTLKALAIHAADEIGADGPDFKHGWGLMNTAAAAQLISSNALNSSHIFEVLLQTNKPYLGHFRVTDTNGLFKVTAVWTDPAPTNLPALVLDPTNSVLMNDIDLRLISPSGQVFEPWVLNPDLTGKSATLRALPATRGDDTRNNVEQVGVRLPQAGIWKAVLTHKGTNLLGAGGTNVTHQLVSLVASGNVEIVADPVEILDMAPVPGNQLAFLFSTEPGRWYDLQWINPVTASNWASIHAVNAQSDLTAITIARPSTNRFYRVLRTQ